MLETYNAYDDFFEWLSTWKKGNRKLSILRDEHWVDEVTQLRVKWKTPDQVAKILENN